MSEKELEMDENTEDQYQDEYYDVEEVEDTNDLKKYLNYAIGAVIVIILAVYGFKSMQESQAETNTEATLMLQRVLPIFNQGDLEKALAGDPNIMLGGKPLMGLKAIADQYSGTGAGELASMFAGRALLDQGKYDEARRYFEDAQSSNSNEVMLGSYSGLAAISEYNSDFASAASNYDKASNLTSEDQLKSRLTYFAGMCFEKAGDNEAAKDRYSKVINMNFDNNYNEFAGMAKQGAQRLGMKFE